MRRVGSSYLVAFLMVCLSILATATEQGGLDTELKAAQGGDAEAMLKLADRYDNGNGTAKDLTEAARWYRKAADAGNTVAMVILAQRYRQGEGVEKDLAEAASWFRKSADRGNADGMRSIGLLCLHGEGVPKDASEGVRWLRKAADLGHVKSMVNLADQYKDGEGVDKDLREAVQWYRKAAEHGSSIAMVQLGVCYKNGEGVEKDPKETVHWMSQIVSIRDRALDEAVNSGNRGASDDVPDPVFDLAMSSLRQLALEGNEPAIAFLKTEHERSTERLKKIAAEKEKAKREGEEIWKRSLVLSDGRHVVVDEKNGEFYAIKDENDPGVKLSGAAKEEAERLFRQRQDNNR